MSLRAKATYDDGTESDLLAGGAYWASSDWSVMSVSAGEVTAKADGQAAITATVGGVTSPALVLSTPVAATSVEVTPATLTLKVGQTADLSALVLPEAADQSVEWSTTDAKVATVAAK